MRRFEIIDGSRRNAKPCAVLSYDLDTREFGIRLEEHATERDVPMMLAPFVRRGEREIGNAWAKRWVEDRIVPSSRQNIGQVLKSHGLREYDEMTLLAASEGRCSQDDFYIREIDREKEGKAVSVGARVGGIVAQARKEAHTTQADLSYRTGIQQAVISRLERGEANPTIETLEAIARGLGKELVVELR